MNTTETINGLSVEIRANQFKEKSAHHNESLYALGEASVEGSSKDGYTYGSIILRDSIGEPPYKPGSLYTDTISTWSFDTMPGQLFLTIDLKDNSPVTLKLSANNESVSQNLQTGVFEYNNQDFSKETLPDKAKEVLSLAHNDASLPVRLNRMVAMRDICVEGLDEAVKKDKKLATTLAVGVAISGGAIGKTQTNAIEILTNAINSMAPEPTNKPDRGQAKNVPAIPQQQPQPQI